MRQRKEAITTLLIVSLLCLSTFVAFSQVKADTNLGSFAETTVYDGTTPRG
ncbi:MAG: hypothetical protein ACTSV3_06630 [Candidatus Thorarchaeota archaeon]